MEISIRSNVMQDIKLIHKELILKEPEQWYALVLLIVANGITHPDV